jgi:hypothetical protein
MAQQDELIASYSAMLSVINPDVAQALALKQAGIQVVGAAGNGGVTLLSTSGVVPTDRRRQVQPGKGVTTSSKPENGVSTSKTRKRSTQVQGLFERHSITKLCTLFNTSRVDRAVRVVLGRHPSVLSHRTTILHQQVRATRTCSDTIAHLCT